MLLLKILHDSDVVTTTACFTVLRKNVSLLLVHRDAAVDFVSEMTYTVSSGTLNSTITYHTVMLKYSANYNVFCACVQSTFAGSSKCVHAVATEELVQR